MDKQTQAQQLRAFELLSRFLNNTPDAISDKLIEKLCNSINCDKTHAFALLLAANCNINTEYDNDKEIFFNFFIPAVHQLNIDEYTKNAYYKNIHFSNKKLGAWNLKYEKYKPFEAFIYNDIEIMPDKRQVPQIGFFDTEFSYPAVLENNRIWMTITPNEIETMKTPIAHAFGNVVTFGLGLGYFAYMVSEKNEVTSITIIEKDKNVIELFSKNIMPQFANAQKIKIIQSDAFDYAQNKMAAQNFNFAFTDLWHDVSDGIPMYLKMKQLEKNCPKTQFEYWIEKSMLCYL